MVENARRQAILVLLVAIAAVIGAFGDPRWGTDLAGGTVLMYEVPVEQTAGPDADLDQVMADTVSVLEDRLDPQGILGALVLRRGETGLQIELPAKAGEDLASIEARIQNLGRLELRVLATADYRGADGTGFDLQEEKRRLEAWLQNEDGANRRSVIDSPGSIDAYNVFAGSTPTYSLTDQLRWYPRVIKPSTQDPGRWDYSSAMDPRDADFAVALFTPAEWDAGPPDEESPRLVELLPINMHERFFTGEDLDAAGIVATVDDVGLPAVGYRMKPLRADEYSEWTRKYVGKKSAIILDGVVQSAPVFESQIRGSGIIRGGFTARDVNDLVAVLRGGSLEVKPIFQARRTIGATLGARSVELGFISILAGGALVLAFILLYYRTAGLVAFSAIALNVLMIWGTLQFLRATLTLPGIAGMVLTMGMAVDANILIYERIREELQRGKALLQAVRSGFKRAMVTILDANITTFIAGIVLYNVGVGPIRGFAVTLMVGIVTTLFTAFFASRLVFHYLLKLEILREFKVADLFGGLKLDFLKYRRVAMAGSLAVVSSGLIYALAFVPKDTLMDLEFIGGANLHVVLKEPITVVEMRERLANDPAFATEFERPLVNTVDDGTEAEQAQDTERSRRFSIKLKLTGEQRETIAAARRHAALEGVDYKPPYIVHLERSLGDLLVDPAYSEPANFEGSASLYLHLASDVSQRNIAAALEARRLPNVSVEPVIAGEVDGRDWLVQWDVTEETPETALFAMVRNGLSDLKDLEGEPVLLSNPFPEAEEIDGRMVGELRSAAIGALVLSLFLIVMYIRIRFREYKYGLAAVAALLHDVLVAFGVLAFVNGMGWVSAEMNLAMIAAFLTIIGYSINDTIVIFDRIRENLSDRESLGSSSSRERESFKDLINRSINQTLSRTILTSGTTMFVVLAQFVVNYNSGSTLEGFSFALIVGILTGTYSTMFIAAPLVLKLREREKRMEQVSETAQAVTVSP